MSASPPVAARALQAFCTSVSNVPQKRRPPRRKTRPTPIHTTKKRTGRVIDRARTLPRGPRGAHARLAPVILDDLLSRRLLILSGKGGVGKSVVGMALAVAAHRRGKRVLFVE